MTLPNKLGYNPKQIALQKRYNAFQAQQVVQQQQQQQQQQLVFDPQYSAAVQQQSVGGYGVSQQQLSHQYGAAAAFGQQAAAAHHYQTQMFSASPNQNMMVANNGLMQQNLMAMSPPMSSQNSQMPSPAPKKSKKRKSNGNNSQSFTPEIQKKKKKKKQESVEGDESVTNQASATPTPPSIQFGSSGIIKSPKVIKEEITQINEVFEKAIYALTERFKNVKIRNSNQISHSTQSGSLLTFKEEEKHKPKEEEMITSFPSQNNASNTTTASQNNATSSSATQDGGSAADESIIGGGNNTSTSVAPQQSLFNSAQQFKLIQSYPVFSVNRLNQESDFNGGNTTVELYEEEKTRKRLFYIDQQVEYVACEDLIDEIIRDADCYFRRELMIHNMSDIPNNIISFLQTRFVEYINNNRATLEKFLVSADNLSQLGQVLSQNESFQQILHQLRSVVESASHSFEEKTKEEASSIVLQSGSTSDVTDEAIDQYPMIPSDDMNQDYSKNVSLIEMTPRDILLVFLGKDAQNEKHEDVNTFLERFRELQKQYRVECSYIDDGLKKWQDTFERVLSNQAAYRVVTFEERHRCKKSLEARFSLMKQLLKDKYLTKVLSLQENTLMRSKRRGNLPRHATNVLKSWLYSHFLHPYPTESEKKDLCMETGLTLTQVNNWFINQRVRTWRPMLESMLDEKDKSATPSSTKGQEKKRGKKNQNQSPPTIQQTPSQAQTQMMNSQNLMMPTDMGSPSYGYGGWTTGGQYIDPGFPFFAGDADLGSPQQ